MSDCFVVVVQSYTLLKDGDGSVLFGVVFNDFTASAVASSTLAMGSDVDSFAIALKRENKLGNNLRCVGETGDLAGDDGSASLRRKRSRSGLRGRVSAVLTDFDEPSTDFLTRPRKGLMERVCLAVNLRALRSRRVLLGGVDVLASATSWETRRAPVFLEAELTRCACSSQCRFSHLSQYRAPSHLRQRDNTSSGTR